jgi:hypothetical protein
MEPVIVIHGTFANEATWWRPDGNFCRLLDNQLKQKGSEAKCWDSIPPREAISEFGWSGLNSEASRTHAAELLSRKIESLSRKPFIKRIHFVAHSHGGNVLLKAFLLCRRKIDNRKLGSFVFLGTPFFEYSSLSPKGAFWRKVSGITKSGRLLNVYSGRDYGGTFFVIQSKYDEAYQLLSKAIHLRDSAYAYSRKLGQKSLSGAPLPPKTLRPLTLLKLRLGRFGILNIRTIPARGSAYGLPKEGPFEPIYIGQFSTLRLAPGIVTRYLTALLFSICVPFISVARRWGQRWGIYFGIKAIVSAALGDDLAFERVLSVKKNTDVVPATAIELADRVEEGILSSVVSGADEIVVRLYRSISFAPSEFELESLAESISDVFKAKQIVHSQYYQNGSVIEIAAMAIRGDLYPLAEYGPVWPPRE